ncbi:hypothetical protein AB0F77_31960 [Streptomyces sp. NPDC026672]|uniref:hypothetical protein n=1 Tax=unclassified Streptomyces TaxID=2593676 RepID=UPI0033F77D43
MPLSSRQMVGDPAQFYAGLRRQARGKGVVQVALDGDVPAYLVIGHAACEAVLKEPSRYTRDLRRWRVLKEGRLPPTWPLAPHVQWMPNMLHVDGEEHHRLRGAFTNSLAKVSARRRQAVTKKAANRLIDNLLEAGHPRLGAGHADLVSQYARPLPVLVLSRIFGFPEEDEPQLQEGIKTLLEGGEGALAAHAEITQIIRAHVERRRFVPRADIVSWLLEAGLTADEVVWTVWLAFISGIASTTAWLANTADLLVRADGTLSHLRSKTQDEAGVMERVLWDHTPVQQVIGRVTTVDVELGGLAVPEGALLIVSLAGANLDPRFGETEALRRSYTEGNLSHLSWGLGSHECPAEPLARSTVRGGAEQLLTRLDDLALTYPDQPTQWSRSIIVRVPDEVVVSYDPARARERAHTLDLTGDH